MTFLPEEERKKIFEHSARFANFCQKFKMEYWRTQYDSSINIRESILDDLAMIAFNILDK